MNNRTLGIVAVVAVAICVGAIWFLQSQPKTTPLPSSESPGDVSAAPPNEAPPTTRPQPAPTAARPPDTRSATIPQPQPLAEWEIKIDQALRANPDNSEAANTATAKTLINMLPTLPPDGQAEAAQHISNLLLDKDYGAVVPLVKNPALPEEVLDVLVTDLMNRDDAVKLPVLLDIAKIPNHPHHEEAQADLQVFLDEDYGNDWAKWESAMKSYLKKQAEEEAAEAAAAKTPPGTRPGAAR